MFGEEEAAAGGDSSADVEPMATEAAAPDGGDDA